MTRWARFKAANGRVGFGVLDVEGIMEYQGNMFERPTPTGATVPNGAFTLLSPCTPSKIIALWNNFHALGAKLGKQAPSHPLYLIKPASSVAGPGEAVKRPLAYKGKIAYEGELGIVIGRRCKDVPASGTSDYVHGYTCVNDVTAGEVLNENPDFAQWCRSKSYDTFGCLGPVIASDFDWSCARVITKLDGVERQNYPLSDMMFSPLELVSRISHDMSLLPGDVIACGTSLGIGSIKDGSTVEVTIDGIGSLVNALEANPGEVTNSL
ncbi:MAG: fumarylacetoacetate hydrolase family protein [Steroidobacteraceae bacterium]|jgi:2-keto-4-pentenoate hydratase/2-oxohepta-3-ene-1,7-dioic acid hydratase in catechol pathway